MADEAIEKPMPIEIVAKRMVPVKPRAACTDLSSNWLRKNRSIKSTEKTAIKPMADVRVIFMTCDIVGPCRNFA